MSTTTLRLQSRRTERDGFSLVELLVVIGIIALLMAILMPVLAMVRKAARGTFCLANLQQWGYSYQMYVSRNHGRSFADRQSITGPAWYEVLQSYNGNVRRTLLCPEATDPGNMIGSASQAWGPIQAWATGAPSWTPRGTFVGSYGFNGWLWQIRSDQRAGLPAPWQRYIDLPAKHPEAVPVFADCIMEWGMPRDTDDVPRNLIHPIPYYSGIGPRPWGPSGMMAYFCIDRHRRAVNIVFLDSHAERVPLEELWKLRWNSNFTPRDVVIPP